MYILLLRLRHPIIARECGLEQPQNIKLGFVNWNKNFTKITENYKTSRSKTNREKVNDAYNNIILKETNKCKQRQRLPDAWQYYVHGVGGR